MAKSFLYFTCPDPKCGKSSHVVIENDDGKVVSHCTTHNAPKAMFDKALEPGFEAHCEHCNSKIGFETETITVLKATKYDPLDNLDMAALRLASHADLAGGWQHMTTIADQPEFVKVLNRELGRLEAKHYSDEWKIRIAGKWLRSFITACVRQNKSGAPNYGAVDAEYESLMTSYIR